MTVDRSVTIRLRVSSAEFDAAMARAGAEVGALRAEIEAVGRSAAKSGNDFKPLLTGALVLGPALIPIAGAALAAGVGLAGMGVAGVAAFKGIQAEIKNNTALGKQLSAQFGVVKTDIGGIEHAAAEASLGAVSQIRQNLSAAAPQLRAEVGRLTAETGDIAGHLVGGLANGLQTVEPLLEHVLQFADKLAVRFETWSTGPGGEKFAAALAEDFDKAVPELEQLVELTGRLIASLNGTGLGTLSVFGLLTKDLNALPLPVLTALLQTIIAMRAAALVAPGVEKLAVALRALGVASAGAGAGAGAGGLLAGITRYAGPAALAIAATAVGINSAANATKSWQYSSDSLARATHATFQAGKDLLSLHWDKIGGDLSERNFDRVNNVIDTINKSIDAGAAAQQRANALYNTSQYIAPPNSGPHFNTPGPTKFSAPIVDPAEIERVAVVNASVDKFNGALTRLHNTEASSPLSAVISGYDQYNTSLAQSNDKISQFLTLGGEAVYTYKGVTVGEKTWSAAMAQTNQNADQARGLIEAQIDLQGRNINQLNRSAAQTNLLNKYVSDSEAKYKLTADQVDMYSQALGLNADLISASAAAEKRSEEALGQVVKQLQNGNEAMQGWLTAVAQSSQGANTLTSRADLLAAGLTALRGVTLSMATTNLSAVSASEAASAAIHDNSASISSNGTLLGQLTKTAQGYVVTQPRLTAGSVAISSAMNQAATSAVDLARSIYANTGNAGQAFAAFEGLRSQFVATQIQTGLSADAAENLARQIFGIPKDAKTFVKLLGKDDVAGAIRDLTTKLGNFSKIIAKAILGATDQATPVIDPLLANIREFARTHTAELVIKAPSNTGSGNLSNVFIRSGGGDIPGHGGGDQHPALLEGGEHVLTVSDVDKAGGQAAVYRMRQQIQSGRMKFATGGAVPSLYVGSGSTGGSSAPAPAPASHAPTPAQLTATAHLKITIDTTDISKFLHSLSGTASQIQSAEKTLADAVTRAGGGASLGSLLARENHTLLGLADGRTIIANRLKAANTKLAAAQKLFSDERATVSGAITGGFDITGAGKDSWGVASLGGILGDIATENAHATLFSQQLKKLSALGLNKNLIKQLAEAGYGTSESDVLALSGGSKSQIAQLNSGVSKLGRTGSAIGTQVATDLYGAGVNAAKGLVAGLKSQEAALSKQMTHLADIMVNQIKHDLGIHSPSLVARGLGSHVGAGLALGIGDQEQAVLASARRVSSAAVNYAGARPVSAASSAPAFDMSQLASAVAKAISRTPVRVAIGGEFGIRGNDLATVVTGKQMSP